MAPPRAETTAVQLERLFLNRHYSLQKIHRICRERSNDDCTHWDEDLKWGFIRYEFKDGSALLIPCIGRPGLSRARLAA